MTISEASKLLGVSASTLRRMEKNGVVEGYGLKVIYTPGGQRRYIYDEIKYLYAQEGFSVKLGFGKKPAILIRDLTKAFTNKLSKLSIIHDEVVNNSIEIIKAAQDKNIPIIFSRTIYKSDNEFSYMWSEKFPSLKILEEDSEWTEIHNQLEGYEFDKVNSTVFINDFYQSGLNEYLKSNGIDTVILLGATTSGSIRSTAIEAFQSGYRVIIPEQAVGDRNQSIQNSNLVDINARYADVTSIEETLNHLNTIKKNVT